MSVYKLLGVFNCLMCLCDIYLMVRLVVKFEIPKAFTVFYYYMFVCAILTFAVQSWSVLYSPKHYWLLKMSVTVFVIMVFRFNNAIKSISHPKEYINGSYN